MTALRLSLLLWFLAGSLVSGAEWKRWPEKADEFTDTIAVPPGFVVVRSQPPPVHQGKEKAPPLLHARFRSPDGKAEFAVTVYYVRHVSSEPEMRRIDVKLGRGEKVTGRKSSREKLSGEHGDYWGYDEETTVGGAGYTRYLLNSFSTSTLPGASSIQWEFRAADEDARKRYAETYRRFKDSFEGGAID